MKKYRVRAWLDEGLFVVLVMAAAAASAALEAGAMIGAMQASQHREVPLARARQASAPGVAVATAVRPDDALSAALAAAPPPRSAH